MVKKKKGRPPLPAKAKHGRAERGTPEYNRISSAISNSIVRFLKDNPHINTQKHLATLLGINRILITHYIKGAKIPNLMTFLRMIAIGIELNIKVGEFFVADEKEDK